MTVTPNVVVSVRGLRTSFGAVRAVDGVDLDIARGEVVGLVGESGSGKTTLGRTILGLTPATEGTVSYEGQELGTMDRTARQRFRRRAQMVFQEPHASLSPRYRISSLLMEPYEIHGVPQDRRSSVEALLEMVELPSDLGSRYPHELSGGQARRIGIARALALRPDFLVFDEPTSGLDVSAAAAVLNLIKALCKEFRLTYLVITHNLNVLGFIADRIAVMYLGQLVEVGPTERVLDAAAHPYTHALLAAASEPDPRRRSRSRRLLLPGEIPSPKNPPSGCRFHTRCRHAEGRCRDEVPVVDDAGAGQLVACHLWEAIRAGAGVSDDGRGPDRAARARGAGSLGAAS